MRNLQEQRGALVEEMQGLLARAEAENRDLHDDERVQYDRIDSEQAALKTRIDNAKRVEDLGKELNDLDGKKVAAHLDDVAGGNKRGTKEYKNAVEQYYRKSGNGIDRDILNALQVGSDSEGGYIVPESFETQIVESMQDWNDFRQYVNVISTGSDRNIPIESTLGAAAYTAEEAAFNESDAAFGQVVLQAFKATRIVKVSEELVQDAFFDIFGYLARNFGKAFGLRQEQSIVAGTGSSQPNGLAVGATDSGIDFASTTAITSDELIDVYHALTRPYRADASWVLNDATLKLIRKLKDGDNQYLWQPGLQAGEPDMLLGKRVLSSQYMPTAAAGNNSVVFGDLSGYTWAERSGRVIQRLNELYAANGQVGFRGFERHDGDITDSSAIIYAEQAAS